MNRVTTGLERLDKLLAGGLPPKTVTLISGGPGSGKTLFGLNFVLNGASKAKKCCYLSVSETEDELLRACKEIKSLNSAEKYLEKNLSFVNLSLGEDFDLDQFTKIFESYPEIDRLVIDNVNKLLMFANDDKNYRKKLVQLIRYLKEKVNCTLLICETKNDEIDTGNSEAFECDGVIHLSFLEIEERPRRILKVHKLRYSSFAPKVPHELVIDSKSLRLSGVKII